MRRAAPVGRKVNSHDGWVSVSEDLLRQSGGFQDHVIVHEVLHLKVHNHSKVFKSLVKAHLSRGPGAAPGAVVRGRPRITDRDSRRSGQSRRVPAGVRRGALGGWLRSRN